MAEKMILPTSKNLEWRVVKKMKGDQFIAYGIEFLNLKNDGTYEGSDTYFREKTPELLMARIRYEIEKIISARESFDVKKSLALQALRKMNQAFQKPIVETEDLFPDKDNDMNFLQGIMSG